MTQNQVTVAQKYYDLRSTGQNKELLDILSEDIVLKSERDGTFTGKRELWTYFHKHPFDGKWDSARVAPNGKVYIQGKIRYLMMNWDALGIFGFDDSDRISRITLKEERFMSLKDNDKRDRG